MSTSLADWQTALVAAIRSPDLDRAMKSIAADVHLTGGNARFHLSRGLKTYRANAQALAHRALTAAYPVLRQMVGEENFEAIARLHWREHPPRRGDVGRWGGDLAGHLARIDDLVGEEPFLPDLARLEWALHRAATAADAAPDLPSLSRLMDEDPARLRLLLAPGTQVLASPWPVVSLHAAHDLSGPAQEEALRAAAQAVRACRAETAVIWRCGWHAQRREALPGEASLLAQTLAGADLARALACAAERPGPLDFAAWLSAAVGQQLLLGVRDAGPVTTPTFQKDSS